MTWNWSDSTYESDQPQGWRWRGKLSACLAPCSLRTSLDLRPVFRTKPYETKIGLGNVYRRQDTSDQYRRGGAKCRKDGPCREDEDAGIPKGMVRSKRLPPHSLQAFQRSGSVVREDHPVRPCAASDSSSRTYPVSGRIERMPKVTSWPASAEGMSVSTADRKAAAAHVHETSRSSSLRKY